MRTLSTLSVSLLLSACATAYQPQGFSGGFSETQLDINVFRVTFKGNGGTSPDRAEDFTLMRSAELTLKNGFTHFVVVAERNDSSTAAFTTPTQSATTGNVSLIGNQAYGSASTTTTGGQMFLIRKPSTTNTIMCFKQKPDVPGLVYDAAFVYRSLAQKYGMPTTLQ